MKKIKNTIALISLLLLVSCGNFLSESSQNLAYVETVSDLEEILLGECYITPKGQLIRPNEVNTFWTNICESANYFYTRIHVMDDDAAEFANGEGSDATKKYSREKFSTSHLWQQNPFYDADKMEIEDTEWTSIYRRISVINSILFQLESIEESDQNYVQRIKGEAHFLRAQYYLWLTNLYGRPYCKATADTDWGVPLKITEYIEDRYFERSSQKDIYNQIVADLEIAGECLKEVYVKKPLRASAYTPYALLSRVYLYMEEYEKAIAAADVVINDRNLSLLNYNTIQDNASTTYQESPETIFTQGYNCMGALHCIEMPTNTTNLSNLACGYTSSEDLMSCYDENDLRLKKFFIERTLSRGTYRCIKWKQETDGVVSDHWLIRLPEVYLNKAEAEACLGLSTAASTLQILRAARFSPKNLSAITQSGAELVQFVRDERRRELCYEGHRWFDLRRYAVNEKFPFTKEIIHYSLKYDKPNKIYYEDGKFRLKPYPEDKAAYVLPVPRSVLDFNKGSITNDPRPERGSI